MAYMSAATLFSGFEPPAGGKAGVISLGAELGHIPHLSTEKRRVGFDGTKLEDLNKTPVFGRLRLELTLPADFSLELGWTPPIGIDGARPDDLYGLAVQRPIVQGDFWTAGMRLFHQRGSVSGDFTCDRETASHPIGTPANPHGCRAPSDDELRIDQNGLEFSVSGRIDDGLWEPFLSYAVTRMKPETHVRAETFGVLDRSVLTADLTTHTVILGALYRPAGDWELLGAMAWTPLDSRRPPDDRRSRHDLYSARLMLRRWWR